jgi:hypothetical protein
MRARLAAGLLGLVLAAGYLVAPPLGTDLSAQVARARFLAGYGLVPVDFRWYGGTVQYGYSLVSPAVMALLGVRPTAALALVVSAVGFAALLQRTHARRPLFGGLVGAVCIAGNLASGRVTYALGVTFGLLALLALTASRPWLRLAGGAGGALLASATSPVAGLFLGLAAAALLLADRRRLPEAVGLGVGAAVPIAVTSVLFGEGGWMNISGSDTVHAVLASLLVALVVPRPVVRIGAVLSALGVLAAYAVHTPVGLNATRLVTMFALPVVAGYALPNGLRLRRLPPDRVATPVALGVLLAGLAWWLPPVLVGDLADAGNPSAYPSYFAPLRAELARFDRAQPIGRIEVPPTRDYWEAAYLGPLARGWLRQVDLSRNPLFFDGTLTADRYRVWLADNGVSYVALPDVEPSWVGRREAELIRDGLPYLSEVWRGRHWVLYRVAGQPSVVDGGTLVSATGDTLTVDVDRAGEVLVRVRWSRWLTVQPVPGGGAGSIDGTGAAGRAGGVAAAAVGVAPRGRWTVLRTGAPGRYTISSGVVSPAR